MRIPDEDLEADDHIAHPPIAEKKTAERVTSGTGTATFVSGSGVAVK